MRTVKTTSTKKFRRHPRRQQSPSIPSLRWKGSPISGAPTRLSFPHPVHSFVPNISSRCLSQKTHSLNFSVPVLPPSGHSSLPRTSKLPSPSHPPILVHCFMLVSKALIRISFLLCLSFSVFNVSGGCQMWPPTTAKPCFLICHF